MPTKSSRPGTYGPAPRPLADRLWTKIEQRGPDDCWPWRPPGNGNGYGMLRVKGDDGRWRKIFAHRLVLEVIEGRPLGPGEYVCHSCDNPPCCNPAHLFRGDAVANAADMVQKRRSAAGERHSQAKLSDDEVRAIRERYATRTIKQRTLAAEYGVGKPTISQIVRGRRRPEAGGPIQPISIRVDR